MVQKTLFEKKNVLFKDCKFVENNSACLELNNNLTQTEIVAEKCSKKKKFCEKSLWKKNRNHRLRLWFALYLNIARGPTIDEDQPSGECEEWRRVGLGVVTIIANAYAASDFRMRSGQSFSSSFFPSFLFAFRQWRLIRFIKYVCS